MGDRTLLLVTVGLAVVLALAGCVSSTSDGNASTNGSSDVPNSSVNSSIADDLSNGPDEGTGESVFGDVLMEDGSDGDGSEQRAEDGQSDGSDGVSESVRERFDELVSEAENGTETDEVAQPTSQDGITVLEVVEPDYLRLKYDDGSTGYVRLVGVAPPPTEGDVLVDQYESIENIRTQKECVRQWGRRAVDHVRATLSDADIQLEYDEDVPRTNQYVGQQAYVIADGENFNKQLIAEGYVRAFTEGFSRQLEFVETEKDARRAGKGLWQCSPHIESDDGQRNLIVQELQAEVPEGTDQENLNEEYVVLKNRGNTTIDTSGWSVHTEGSRSFTFPDPFELRPGATVTIHSGNSFSFRSADKHATDLYWGSISPVWPNDGGTVIVRDAAYNKRVQYAYGDEP